MTNRALAIAGLAIFTGSLRGQPATQKFDVASIRPCEGLSPGVRAGSGSLSPGRMTLRCTTVADLIRTAYVMFANGRYNPYASAQTSGGPAWVSSARYNLNTEAEDNASAETMQGPMLQALLEDRFQLKIHRETREIPVYALTVAKGGSKLQPVEPGSCPAKMPSAETVALLQAGKALPKFCGSTRFGRKIADFHGMSVDEFSKNFGRVLDRSVVDKTGIAGMFDFHLEFAPDQATPGLLPGGALRFTDTPSDDPPGGPSIFTAIEEQLGLRLEPAKGPGEFLVIDHVERPSEN
jgi:uncharacterized protein (TIGR03435 family)